MTESRSPLDPQFLDGHTVEELSDYLDRGRTPADPAIESSPGAQNALAALARLRSIAPKVLEADAKARKPRNDGWIQRILDQIGVQAHAGRDIPIHHDEVGADLSISEGAVRAIVREVGDDLDGAIVERCRLDGEVDVPGSPVTIRIDISIFDGADSRQVLESLREGILAALALHTELTVAEVIIHVQDFHVPDDEGQAHDEGQGHDEEGQPRD